MPLTRGITNRNSFRDMNCQRPTPSRPSGIILIQFHHEGWTVPLPRTLSTASGILATQWLEAGLLMVICGERTLNCHLLRESFVLVWRCSKYPMPGNRVCGPITKAPAIRASYLISINKILITLSKYYGICNGEARTNSYYGILSAISYTIPVAAIKLGSLIERWVDSHSISPLPQRSICPIFQFKVCSCKRKWLM